MIQPAQELARCRVLPPVDAGSCGVGECRRRAAVLDQAQQGRPPDGGLGSEAGARVRRLDHRPSWAAQGDNPRVEIWLIPKPRPMPNELIGSREHNWLTSKVLSTAVRAHCIGSVTLGTADEP